MAGVAGNLGGLHFTHTVDGYLESRACGFTDEAGRTLPGLSWLRVSAVDNKTFSICHLPFLIFHLKRNRQDAKVRRVRQAE